MNSAGPSLGPSPVDWRLESLCVSQGEAWDPNPNPLRHILISNQSGFACVRLRGVTSTVTVRKLTRDSQRRKVISSNGRQRISRNDASVEMLCLR